MSRILIVEDDRRLSRGLVFAVESDQHTAAAVYSAEQAYEALAAGSYELAILDVNLPGADGFETGRFIREIYPEMAVIFLTARDLDEDQEQGFNIGADDYITKPFNMSLFRKRVNAVLRRYRIHQPDQYEDDYLMIDFDSMRATAGEQELFLTPTEIKLLKLFTSRPDQVLTRQILLEAVWDKEENYVDEHTLTVNINRLRKKLERQGHVYIKTVYGMGYKWEEKLC